MLLVEPPRSNYDLHFQVAGVPVRVHPFFWLAAFFLGFQPGAGSAALLIWIGCMFVSILVHEMGHALAIRHFGWKPRVTLYHLGGLASFDATESYDFSYNANQDNPRVRILIAAAGPAAGFVLAALVLGIAWAINRPIPFRTGGSLGFYWDLRGVFPYEKTNILVDYLLQINIFWGLMNLLPVFPLDGGQIAVQLLEARRPHVGTIQGLWVSVYTGAGVALLALIKLWPDRSGFFIALMFGILAAQCYMMIQRLRGSGYGSGYDDNRNERDW